MTSFAATINGRVFNDTNGLRDNAVNGTGTNAGGLFVTVSNTRNTTIYACVPVNEDGTYTVTGLAAGAYVLRLSVVQSSPGSGSSTVNLPPNWTSTGDVVGTAIDTWPNSAMSVSLAAASTIQNNVNFGTTNQSELAVVIVSPALVDSNGELVYTLQVTNIGLARANNAVLQMPASSNFSASAVSCTSGQANAGNSECPASPTVADLEGDGLVIPLIPPGGTVTLAVSGVAGSGGDITKSAAIISPAGASEANPANNSNTRNTHIAPRGSQTVYTLDPAATRAGAGSIGANGGTVNLVYNLTSGPAVATLGNSFTIPMRYTDFDNTSAATNHTWSGYNSSATEFIIIPDEQSWYSFPGLPERNRTLKSSTIGGGSSDNFYSASVAASTYNPGLTPLGNFHITFGDLPALPSNVKLEADQTRIRTTFNTLNNTANPGEEGTNTGSATMTAYLVDENGNVAGSSPVASDGTYSTGSAEPGKTYTLVLSNVSGIQPGQPAPAPSLPDGWSNTGEAFGSGNQAGSGTETATPGIIAVTAGETDLTGVDFAIVQHPDSDPENVQLPTQPNSGDRFTLDGSEGGLPPLTGSDPAEQPEGGSLENRTIAITALPANGELGYDNTTIVTGQDGINPVSEDNPFVIRNFNPQRFALVLTGQGYNSTSFSFAYINSAGVQDPSPATYMVSWEAPLPVKLAWFGLSRENRSVVLEWKTAQETNFDYFEIQRSSDAKRWISPGAIRGQNTGADRLATYSYTDAQPASGLNYYRLKLVDRDNTFELSPIKSINLQRPDNDVQVYPNPVAGRLILSGIGQPGKITLIDISGRKVLEGKPGADGSIGTEGLAEGVYILKVTDRYVGTVATFRLIISR